MITDIIFDFFGTLVDYNESRILTGTNTSYEYLCRLGFKINKEEYLKQFDKCFSRMEKQAVKNKSEFHMHELGKYFFEKVFNHSISDDKNKIFIRKYINDWNSKTIYFDNIRNFIKELSRDYRLSILSNTHYPGLIHDNLKKMNIKKYFYKVYTSVEIGTRKPNKEIFEFALKNLKISSKNAVFVGDSYKDDYIGARKANVKCYLIDREREYCKTVKTRINNLFELIQKEIPRLSVRG